MTAQGPSYPTSAVSSGSPPALGGTEYPWSSSPSGIQADGGLAAGTTLSAQDDYTAYLRGTGFNFSVPTGRVITGVVASIKRRGPGSGLRVADYRVNLIVANSVQGDSKATGTTWPDSSSYAVKEFGSATDLWGLALTPAVVNASDFGLAMAARGANAVGPIYVNPEVDSYTLTVYYADPATGQVDVQQSIAVSPAFFAFSKDVAQAVSVSRETAYDVSQTISVSSGLEVTNPSPAEVITSSAWTITWLMSPNIQSDYRVKIYSDASETTLVYDSGIVGSTETQHAVPSGALPTGTLYLRIIAHDTSQIEVRSSLVQFSTSYPTSGNVSGVTTRVDGGICDADALPQVDVRWTQVVPGAGETFVQYDVLRRPSSTATWTRIAIVDTIATVRYRDANAAPNVVYEYAVLWQAQSGASRLISAVQSSLPNVILTFDWTFLHVADDTSRWVRLEVLDASQEADQDIAYFQPWGRRSPTAHVGEALHAKFSVPVTPQQIAKTSQWDKILDLLEAQREGHVLCLRMGKARTSHFVTINGSRRQLQERSYNTALQLTETFYDEAVVE